MSATETANMSYSGTTGTIISKILTEGEEEVDDQIYRAKDSEEAKKFLKVLFDNVRQKGETGFYNSAFDASDDGVNFGRLDRNEMRRRSRKSGRGKKSVGEEGENAAEGGEDGERTEGAKKKRNRNRNRGKRKEGASEGSEGGEQVVAETTE